MNYYNFHIGDYISHTIHLSLEEDLAYRRLLDMYYDTELPIPNNIPLVSRKLRIAAEVVKTVLEEFFELGEDGYRNFRADNEINEYRKFIDKQKANGSKGGRPKKSHRKPTANPSQSQNNPNQEPITNNHKPIKEKATIVATPKGVSQSVWDDFKILRKAKKAPITQRAIDGLIAEANKAGWTLEQGLIECCMRGWQAFKAEWVVDKPKLVNRFDVVTTTVSSKQERDPALVKLDEDRKKVVGPTPEMLEKFKLLRAGK